MDGFNVQNTWVLIHRVRFVGLQNDDGNKNIHNSDNGISCKTTPRTLNRWKYTKNIGNILVALN